MRVTVEPIVIHGKEFTPEAGSHSPNGAACVMELVSYLRHEPWSDAPKCASPVIGAFCRSFWDASSDNWPGLIERLDRIAGSANPDADDARAWLATDWLVRTFTPVWLRKAGLDAEADALIALPALTTSALANWDAAGVAAVLDAALAETIPELRASAFDLLDRMLLQGAPA